MFLKKEEAHTPVIEGKSKKQYQKNLFLNKFT